MTKPKNETKNATAAAGGKGAATDASKKAAEATKATDAKAGGKGGKSSTDGVHKLVAPS